MALEAKPMAIPGTPEARKWESASAPSKGRSWKINVGEPVLDSIITLTDLRLPGAKVGG